MLDEHTKKPANALKNVILDGMMHVRNGSANVTSERPVFSVLNDTSKSNNIYNSAEPSNIAIDGRFAVDQSRYVNRNIETKDKNDKKVYTNKQNNKSIIKESDNEKNNIDDKFENENNVTHEKEQNKDKNSTIKRKHGNEDNNINDKPTTKHIYLDYQATTPIDPRVLDSMLPYLTTYFGNPSSRTHKFGWDAESAVNKARSEVATLIGARPDEIFFVSGATEANNIALKGIARFKMAEMNDTLIEEENDEEHNDNNLHVKHDEVNGNTKNNDVNNEINSSNNNDKYNSNKKVNKKIIKPHFITAQTEHKSVLSTLRDLEAEGCEVTYLKVKENGLIDINDLKHAIKKNTICVSVMTVNNEIGVVQDLESIGKVCKENNIILHTDAAQGYGKIEMDVDKMNIGMMGISGHKIYGPKGIGALFLRRRPRIRIQPLISGGGQERGIRSGTVPTALVVGMGKAAVLCQKEMKRDFEHVKRLSEKLESFLRKNLGEVIKNGYGGIKINGKNEQIRENINSGETKEYVNEIFHKTNDKKNKDLKSEQNSSGTGSSGTDSSGTDSTGSSGSNGGTESTNFNTVATNSRSGSDNNVNEFINQNILNKLKIEKKTLKNYPGCLNLSFAFVEGEGLMMALNNIALSSGSACTSSSLEPSYTLRALGTDDDLAHSSIRFGIGRFTTDKEVDEAGRLTVKAVNKLREMSPLYEMMKEGIDLKKIEWSQ
ncbi:cysteine desulfurase [Conglomerata obtusa]